MRRANYYGLIVIVVAIVLLAVGAWWYLYNSPTQQQQPATQTRSLISTVAYSCGKGKTITAAYYNGPVITQPAPGEPPMPTGSVDVSFGSAPTTTLAQTISADGVRYSDGNPQISQGQPGAEMLVFWSKGDSVLILRNNTMDLDYTNCTATSSPAGA